MSALERRLESSEPVRRVREALASAGVEDAWVVGGTVRDALLGRPIADVDLAVRGDAGRVARALADDLRGPLFELSDEFGSWRVIGRSQGFVCDVSPLQGATIEEDLARRDFGVNAMALPVAGGGLLDPQGGLADLEAGRLRVLGGPDLDSSAYAGDAVRALRLARLATELELEPDARTAELTRLAAPRLARSPGERVFAELRRLVVADRALYGIDLAERLGLMDVVLPELTRLRGVEQSHFHHLDVHDHTIEVLRRQIELEGTLGELFGELAPRVEQVLAEPLANELTRGQALRFAALLHDAGKPDTRAETPEGRVLFMGHDEVGAGIVRRTCRRLRTSDRLARFLAGIVRHHLVLGFLVHERPLSRRDVYRYLTRCEPVEIEVTLLTCADRLATRGKNAEAAIAAHLELARELMAEALEWRASGPPELPIRGDELARELGIELGPELGELLARLREARFAGEAQTREQAVAMARSLRENPGR